MPVPIFRSRNCSSRSCLYRLYRLYQPKGDFTKAITAEKSFHEHSFIRSIPATRPVGRVLNGLLMHVYRFYTMTPHTTIWSPKKTNQAGTPSSRRRPFPNFVSSTCFMLPRGHISSMRNTFWQKYSAEYCRMRTCAS